MEDDDYWSEPCACCRSEERNRTNLECVEEVARNTGTPLEEAKRLFRGPERQVTEMTVWQPYVARYKHENGEPE